MRVRQGGRDERTGQLGQVHSPLGQLQVPVLPQPQPLPLMLVVVFLGVLKSGFSVSLNCFEVLELWSEKMDQSKLGFRSTLFDRWDFGRVRGVGKGLINTEE
jgi:hypothetical protein